MDTTAPLPHAYKAADCLALAMTRSGGMEVLLMPRPLQGPVWVQSLWRPQALTLFLVEAEKEWAGLAVPFGGPGPNVTL